MFFRKILSFLDTHFEESQSPVIAFGIFGLINYPLFYLYWRDITPQEFNNMMFRLVAVILCLILVLKNKWPKKLKKYFSLYWYVSIFYCLPFFGTFMLLKNQASTMWLMNVMLVIFLLILLVDWLMFSILVSLGTLFGTLAYYFFSSHSFEFLFTSRAFSAFSTYILSIIVGVIFSRNVSRNKENTVLKKQLASMKLLSASVAHELRTPMNSIRHAAEGLKQYLPILFSAYEVASKNNLPIHKIRKSHYDILKNIPESIDYETKAANTFIDMTLMQTSIDSIDKKSFKVCSIKECIEQAIIRYPFSSEKQKSLLAFDNSEDFLFIGNQTYVIHIFFNLIKNALFFIEAEQKGEIRIWIKKKNLVNQVHFKDTAKGISNEIKILLFDQFYSKREGGTGVGLAFCRSVMTSLGGKITCMSKKDKYTEFILDFPKK